MNDESDQGPIFGLMHDYADEMEEIVSNIYRKRQAVALSKHLHEDACQQAELNGRSLLEQIEHRVRTGKIAEAHPDLNYKLIQTLLISSQEFERGRITPISNPTDHQSRKGGQGKDRVRVAEDFDELPTNFADYLGSGSQ